MSCSVTREKLERYFHGRDRYRWGTWPLDPFLTHVLQCPSCRGRLDEMRAQQRKETEHVKEHFPNLYAQVTKPYEHNWQESWFRWSRRRKLAIKSLAK